MAHGQLFTPHVVDELHKVLIEHGIEVKQNFIDSNEMFQQLLVRMFETTDHSYLLRIVDGTE